MSNYRIHEARGLEVIPSATSSEHDFDFLIGDWTIRNKKLKERLNKCTDWLEFEANHSCQKILKGYGNTEHFSTKFDGVPFEALGLRLFNPKTRLWSIYWADSINVVLDVPQVGSFENGVGRFYADDLFQGKPIIVMFEFEKRNPENPIWRQAFSPDKGETWEWNWMMSFQRNTHRR